MKRKINEGQAQGMNFWAQIKEIAEIPITDKETIFNDWKESLESGQPWRISVYTIDTDPSLNIKRNYICVAYIHPDDFKKYRKGGDANGCYLSGTNLILIKYNEENTAYKYYDVIKHEVEHLLTFFNPKLKNVTDDIMGYGNNRVNIEADDEDSKCLQYYINYVLYSIWNKNENNAFLTGTKSTYRLLVNMINVIKEIRDCWDANEFSDIFLKLGQIILPNENNPQKIKKHFIRITIRKIKHLYDIWQRRQMIIAMKDKQRQNLI